MKTALVTGGTQGIGLGIAKVLAQSGYFVGITYASDTEAAKRAEESLLAIPAACGVAVYRADVSDEEATKATVRDFIGKVRHIDLLVNNAGIDLSGLFMDTTLSDWQRVFDVNVTGTFLYTKEVLPHMLERGGNIVNIASIWGEVGGAMECAYSATKGAVIALTKALAKEVASAGIRVNCVSPGVVDTRMNERFSAEERQALEEEIPLGRIAGSEEIGQAVLFLAESGTYITGQVLSVNGGFGC